MAILTFIFNKSVLAVLFFLFLFYLIKEGRSNWNKVKSLSRLGIAAGTLIALLGIAMFVIPAESVPMKPFSEAARSLVDSGIPAEVIDSYDQCSPNITTQCSAYPITNSHATSVKIEFVPMETLGGLWSGKDATLKMETETGESFLEFDGSSHKASWDLFGISGSATPGKITPWLQVNIKVADQPEHEFVNATANLLVLYPVNTGVTTYENSSRSMSRELRFFILSDKEMNELKLLSAKTITAKDLDAFFWLGGLVLSFLGMAMMVYNFGGEEKAPHLIPAILSMIFIGFLYGGLLFGNLQRVLSYINANTGISGNAFFIGMWLICAALFVIGVLKTRKKK